MLERTIIAQSETASSAFKLAIVPFQGPDEEVPDVWAWVPDCALPLRKKERFFREI